MKHLIGLSLHSVTQRNTIILESRVRNPSLNKVKLFDGWKGVVVLRENRLELRVASVVDFLKRVDMSSSRFDNLLQKGLSLIVAG